MEVPFALALERGQDAEAGGSELRVHAARHDCAGLLRGLAPRRPHRPHVREREAPGAGAIVRRGAGGERGGREDDRRLAGPAAGVVRQGARRAFRAAARGAARGARRPRPCETARAAAGRRDARRRHASGGGRLRIRATTRRSSAYGRALAAAGDRAAFEPLEKAAALVPITSGEDTPHAIMARLAEQARRYRARDGGVQGRPRAGSHDRGRGAAARGARREGVGHAERWRWRTSASSRSTRSIRSRTAGSAGSP